GAALRAERGSYERAYPAFSSKPLRGEPLFLHALRGTLASHELPTHTETIYRIDLVEQQALSVAELEVRVRAVLSLVPKTLEPSKTLGADFRITAVKESWETLCRQARGREFSRVRLRVACSSGTYMRSLAARL